MIIEFPKIRSHDVIVETSGNNFIHTKCIVTRRPWFRLIWNSTQKTLLVGQYRFTIS
jgi:hypothetical protein